MSVEQSLIAFSLAAMVLAATPGIDTALVLRMSIYTVINFTSEPSFPAELDRVYKITEGVMRSLIVAHEE